MKIIISPAKKLNENPCDINSSTSISFHNESQTIVNELKDYSSDKLISLMNVSPNIANLNNQRFNNWEYPFQANATKPAVFMFDGAVYNELSVQTLEAKDCQDTKIKSVDDVVVGSSTVGFHHDEKSKPTICRAEMHVLQHVVVEADCVVGVEPTSCNDRRSNIRR